MLMCPRCGESRHVVLDTRRSRGGVRRRRQCFNNHVFWTVEMVEVVAKVTRRQDRWANAVERRRERYLRDQRIVRMVRSGVSKALVADRFRLAPTTISHVLGKYAPELKGRRQHGQG